MAGTGAIYWVHNLLGDDANDGLSALPGGPGEGPFQSLHQGLSALQFRSGFTNWDELNIINTGTPHIIDGGGNALGTELNGIQGQNSTRPGAEIKGTDINGNPDIVTLVFENNIIQTQLFNLLNSTFITFKGLIVDWTALTLPTTSKHFGSLENTNSGPAILRYNHFKQNRNISGDAHGGQIIRATAAIASQLSTDIRYCYIDDPKSDILTPLFEDPDGGGGVFGIHCVWDVGATPNTLPVIVFESLDNPSVGKATQNNNNTIIARPDNLPGGLTFFDWQIGLAVVGTRDLRNWANLVVSCDTDAGAINQYIIDSIPILTLLASFIRIIGANVFGGLSLGDGFLQQFGPYQRPWDPDDSDIPEGEIYWTSAAPGPDQVTEEDPFSAKDIPWAWKNIDGSGYNIILRGDYRLKLHSPYDNVVDPSYSPDTARYAGALGVVEAAPEIEKITNKDPCYMRDRVRVFKDADATVAQEKILFPGPGIKYLGIVVSTLNTNNSGTIRVYQVLDKNLCFGAALPMKQIGETISFTDVAAPNSFIEPQSRLFEVTVTPLEERFGYVVRYDPDETGVDQGTISIDLLVFDDSSEIQSGRGRY